MTTYYDPSYFSIFQVNKFKKKAHVKHFVVRHSMTFPHLIIKPRGMSPKISSTFSSTLDVL